MQTYQPSYLAVSYGWSIGDYLAPICFTSNIESMKTTLPQLFKAVGEAVLKSGGLSTIAHWRVSRRMGQILYLIPQEWIDVQCPDLYVFISYEPAIEVMTSSLEQIQKKDPTYQGQDLHRGENGIIYHLRRQL